MSAALTLPYVWAAVSEHRVERSTRLRPLGGLTFYRKSTEAYFADICACRWTWGGFHR